MSFFRKLFGLFFLGLLVFGLLGLFGGRGYGRYDSVYRQGFIDGQQAAAGGEGAEGTTTMAPTSAPGTQVYYQGHDYFFPGSAFLLCLVPLFAFGLLFMSFGRRRRHGRHGGWGPCGPWKHGPWGQWEDGPQEKSPDDIDDGPDEAVKYA